MINRLLTQAVTVEHYAAGAVDDYGNPADTWGTPANYLGRLEQRDATEVTVDGDVQRSDHRLFLPPTAVIGGRDRVVYNGRTFDVIGPPGEEPTPRGTHHLVVNLRHLA